LFTVLLAFGKNTGGGDELHSTESIVMKYVADYHRGHYKG